MGYVKKRLSTSLIIMLMICSLVSIFMFVNLFAYVSEAAESKATPLPQDEWKLKYADSEETQGEDGKALNVFDGNEDTYWHTKYNPKIDSLPHEIQIDLGGIHEMSGFRYLPRQIANANGTVKDYEVYISMDGENWGDDPVAKGSFDNSITEKEILFEEPVIGNHIRFVALSEVNGKQFTSMAELNVLQTERNIDTKKILTSDKSTVSLNVGQTEQLHVGWKFGDVEKDITNSATYTSLDSDVATISSDGLITARDRGTTTIRIEDGNAEPIDVTVTIEKGEANHDITVREEDNLITIENWYMARTFDISDNKIIPNKIVNRRSGDIANVSAGEEFVIHLEDDTVINASDLTLKSWEEIEDSEAEGKTLKFTFEEKDGLTVYLYVEMKREDHFMRKHVEIDSTDSELHVSRIDLESLHIPGPYWSSPVDGLIGSGQPVYANDLFFGVEFPGSDNKMKNNKVISTYALGQPEIGGGTLKSKTSVSGVAPRQEEVRAGFLDYVDTIALPPRFQLQYNGWFELYHDADSESLIETYKEIEKGMSSYGVRPLDIYAADDGWMDYKKGFWDFNKQTFPNNFDDQYNLLKHFNSNFGVWLGPSGGYKEPGAFSKRLREEYGYETVGGRMDVTGPKYTQALKERMMELTDQYDVNYWKLDGFNVASNDPAYFSNFWNIWIDIFQDLREHEKDIFLNITTGSNNSPWLLPYVNSVWLNVGTDAGYKGTGSDRDQMLTYVDDKYYTRFKVQQSQMPLRFIYNHEPIHGLNEHVSKPAGHGYTQTNEEWRKYLFMNLVRGTGFVELYYSPSRFDDAQWTINADVLTWAEDNFDALSNTDMIGGNPVGGDVYGYSGWTQEKGIVGIRNPSSEEQTYELTLDSLIGVKDKQQSYYRKSVYPYGDSEDGPYEYGHTFTITLQPHEAYIWQFEVGPDEVKPEIDQVKAEDATTIDVSFTERVEQTSAEDIENYTVNNGVTVADAVLNEDYTAVKLTVSGLEKDTTDYTLTVNNVKDMANNAIKVDSSAGFSRADDGLVAHWKFSEGKGELAVDATGNGNGATIYDAIHIETDDFDALQLNGTSSYVDGGLSSSITNTGDMALSARIKTSAEKEQVIIQQGKDKEGQYQLKLDKDGHVQWQTSINGSDDGFDAVSDDTVNDGKWHHIVVVREVNGLGKIYIDGELNGSDYTGTKVDLTQANVYIGKDPHTNDQYFEGGIADIRIYNRSLAYDELDIQPDIPIKSAADMKSLVERFEEADAFKGIGTAHALKLHLTAVERYEKKEKAEKVVKHMESFKLLLEHQRKNELISEEAYNFLIVDSNGLIGKWQ